MPRALLGLLATGSLLAACREEPKAAKPAAASAPKSTPSAAAPLTHRAVSGENAFDLAVLPDGAALALGQRGGGVSVVLLDHRGGERAPPLNVAASSEGSASEVVAASRDTELAVAWVARHPTGTVASWAALGDAGTRTFATTLPMGEVRGDPSLRGTIAVTASENEGFVALRRGLDEPCEHGEARQCTAFALRELRVSGAEPRGLPMAVPAPCPRVLAGLVVVGSRWHYGFCSQAEGQAVTTHFMRQLTPFFVEVHRSFEGCTPLGATVVGDDALLAADCPDGRRGLLVNGMNQKQRAVELSKAEIGCERGVPVLRAPGESPLELSLKEPRGGLAVLLPARLAPGNTRAVWTGTTLLSASWSAGDVALRRYECSGSELVGR